MVSPNAEPMVLAAAALAGVDRAFAVGGAQAVAALAYGTASVPRVDKIVGPGNAYVAAAKRQVFGQVGIDIRITSYNVCYTKLLRSWQPSAGAAYCTAACSKAWRATPWAAG